MYPKKKFKKNYAIHCCGTKTLLFILSWFLPASEFTSATLYNLLEPSFFGRALNCCLLPYTQIIENDGLLLNNFFILKSQNKKQSLKF